MKSKFVNGVLAAVSSVFAVVFILAFTTTAMAIVPDEKTNPTPEPATLALLGAGMIGLGIWGKKKSKKHDVKEDFMKKTLMILTIVILSFVSNSYAIELVINGSFESPNISPGTFIISNNILGWTRDSGSIGRGIEVQNHIAGSPFMGNQFAELDSDATTAIFQDIMTTPGTSYLLSFAFSPRPGVSQNIMNISWGGLPVDIISANGTDNFDTVWTVFSYNLIAASSMTRLRFDNLTETSNGLGSYIDAVSVKPTSGTPEPATMTLLGSGLAGLGIFRGKFKRNKIS